MGCTNIYSKKRYNVSIPSLKNIATVDDAVQKIINKNKKKISVIGFSMGGFIAIKLAIEYPEILDKLVLIGTNARNISQKRKLLLEKSLTTLSKDNFAKFSEQLEEEYLKSNPFSSRLSKYCKIDTFITY